MPATFRNLPGYHSRLTVRLILVLTRFLLHFYDYMIILFNCYSLFTYFLFSGNALLLLNPDVFTFLQHCCYGVVCHIVRSLVAFVCQEIKGLLTYFLYLKQSFFTITIKTRCAAIAARPCCRVRHCFAQKWKTGTGRKYFTDIIGLSSTTQWHNRPENLSNLVKNAK